MKRSPGLSFLVLHTLLPLSADVMHLHSLSSKLPYLTLPCFKYPNQLHLRPIPIPSLLSIVYLYISLKLKPKPLTSSTMRLPSYSQPIPAPVSFNSESWDTILLSQSQKQKFQNFCELFMDRVRTGASTSEEVERFTTLLKGEHPEYFRLARGVVPEFKFGNA